MMKPAMVGTSFLKETQRFYNFFSDLWAVSAGVLNPRYGFTFFFPFDLKLYWLSNPSLKHLTQISLSPQFNTTHTAYLSPPSLLSSSSFCCPAVLCDLLRKLVPFICRFLVQFQWCFTDVTISEIKKYKLTCVDKAFYHRREISV